MTNSYPILIDLDIRNSLRVTSKSAQSGKLGCIFGPDVYYGEGSIRCEIRFET